MAELVFQIMVGLVLGALAFIMLYPADTNKKEPEYPPKGYAIDFLLKNKDRREGVSEAEIKRRERTGYYLIKIHDNGEIADREHWGKPKY